MHYLTQWYAGLRICPGFIDTPINKQEALDAGQTYEEMIEETLVSHSVKRLGSPDDIAQAALFLASEHTAGFITGQSLVVDGGLTSRI
jgi:NAD(P)-dependent dehydrogenase (short-subunit alcohol dehydrogenase family)